VLAVAGAVDAAGARGATLVCDVVRSFEPPRSEANREMAPAATTAVTIQPIRFVDARSGVWPS
jgi:hypothetical protein